MLIPVTCISCGMAINDVEEAFREALKENLIKDPNFEAGKLAEEFGITNDCCKTRLLNSKKFYDALYKPAL